MKPLDKEYQHISEALWCLHRFSSWHISFSLRQLIASRQLHRSRSASLRCSSHPMTAFIAGGEYRRKMASKEQLWRTILVIISGGWLGLCLGQHHSTGSFSPPFSSLSFPRDNHKVYPLWSFSFLIGVNFPNCTPETTEHSGFEIYFETWRFLMYIKSNSDRKIPAYSTSRTESHHQLFQDRGGVGRGNKRHEALWGWQVYSLSMVTVSQVYIY